MRKNQKKEGTVPARVRQGRAVLVGYGLDDDGGHFRYTRGDDIELIGGSASAHGEMERRAKTIRDEIARLGITLSGMTYDEYQLVKTIVDRVNAE
ncbi:MAG: hypothetical protein LIQ30_07520 [Planctomycetes bacterium]|nr:hypothetical protein [Planctomycetota bacterium]MCD7895606.1 hypothetical protein [Planctomycetaceae bacterium]